MRILLTVEYRGTNYHGWQKQKDLITVSETIEQAIFDITGKATALHGAGRTDAGVHAYNMKAHFDIEHGLPPEKYAYALNNALPPDIKIRKSELVGDNFHSRFDAVNKTYLYKIYLAPTLSGLYYDTHYSIYAPLDIIAMKEGSQYLIGTHDFRAFMSQGSNPSSTIRTIFEIDVTENIIDDGYGKELVIKIKGNSFLYNMVRIIIAQLIRVGKKIIPPQEIACILESKKRRRAREIAPPEGLYLYEINY